MRKLEQYQPEKQKKGEQTGLISVIVTVYNIRGISAQSGGFDSFFDLSKSRSPFDR